MDGSASGATNSGEQGEAVAERRADGWKLGRREFLVSAAAAAALPRRLAAAAAPWAERPGGKVDRVNFVVWTYGDIYTKISKKFADDWGVTVDSTISSFNDHPTKLMTMYAGGETIDVRNPPRSRFPVSSARGWSSHWTDCPARQTIWLTSPSPRSRSRSMTAN